MKGKRYTTEEKIRLLREADQGEKGILDICREANISEVTFHRWKKQFGHMEVNEARRLKELERENTELITGLSNPYTIVISGSDLFVANYDAGTIGEYTLSGATVNVSLISGLNTPYGLAISGNDLYVANQYGNSVGEYTLSGATVNASLISGITNPLSIVAVPEPSIVALAGLGTAAFWLLRRRK